MLEVHFKGNVEFQFKRLLNQVFQQYSILWITNLWQFVFHISRKLSFATLFRGDIISLITVNLVISTRTPNVSGVVLGEISFLFIIILSSSGPSND